MQPSILLSILFDLLAGKKVTAAHLSLKYNLSTRTIYRYVEQLALVAPVYVKSGRNGGIYIADNYKLPVGFMTREEYEAAIDALIIAYEKSPEHRFLSAQRKLNATVKEEQREHAFFGESDDFITDGGAPYNSYFTKKLRLIRESLQNKAVLYVEYYADNGTKIHSHIEPHVLVNKQNAWYVYAFCHNHRTFHLFSLGRFTALAQTEEIFRPRPFSEEDILRSKTPNTLVKVRFSIEKPALLKAREFFGAETVHTIDGKYYADVELLDDETLIHNILTFGKGITVIEPISVQQRVIQALQELSDDYQK